MRVPAVCSALVLTLAQLFHGFNMRDATADFLSDDVSHKLYVWLAQLLCAALLVGSAYLPVLSTVLEPRQASGWIVILVLALFPLLADKAARRL
jgi:Ca2+-transporting ATPase